MTHPETQTDQVSKTTLIIAIFASVLFTIFVMEWQGMIKHTDNKEDYALSSYEVVYIDRQENDQYRLSRKPSQQSATCHEGFLFIASDVNPDMQGLLVDYKNRGVKCAPASIANSKLK